ncbi:MAG: leucyl/phenylalanyl-tRNA--protein transferase [Bacteroidetes bacterium]|nr:MAG: leucyl/phenylalanyl-tRNA--protein transferase [Bacteroidota bacterium]
MPIFLLNDDDVIFPDPSFAEGTGLLAVGGDLSPDRLLEAYRHGIFPWYNPGEEVLWWSLDPRFVLFPDELKVSKSMRPYFNQKKFEVTYDTRFRQVMVLCRDQYRKQQFGSWISNDMIEAYVKLHELGYAHSVEVWKEEQLVGGLYGLSLGKMFFGESMFSLETNASKFGFITLVRKLESLGFIMIDCQQETPHLGSLGARGIPRSEFLKKIEENNKENDLVGNWGELLGK